MCAAKQVRDGDSILTVATRKQGSRSGPVTVHDRRRSRPRDERLVQVSRWSERGRRASLGGFGLGVSISGRFRVFVAAWSDEIRAVLNSVLGIAGRSQSRGQFGGRIRKLVERLGQWLDVVRRGLSGVGVPLDRLGGLPDGVDRRIYVSIGCRL